MNKEQLELFNRENWEVLTPKLLKYCKMKANRLIWKTPAGTLPNGKTAEDFLFDAIEKTLEGIQNPENTNKRIWNRDINPSLEEHLKDVIDSLIDALVKSKSHASAVHVQECSEIENSAESSNGVNLNDEFFNELFAQVKIHLRDDHEALNIMGAFIEIYTELEIDRPKPQDVADHLGLEIRTVNNALKRIRLAGNKIRRAII